MRLVGVLLGEAAGERHGDRLQYCRMLVGEGQEVRLRQLEHDQIVECRDGGPADPVGEEANLAEGRAAADLGDAPFIHRDGEVAGRHEIERVSRIALAHENFVAGDRDRYEALLEVGKLRGRQIAEGLDQRKEGGSSCASLPRRPPCCTVALASDRVV